MIVQPTAESVSNVSVLPCSVLDLCGRRMRRNRLLQVDSEWSAKAAADRVAAVEEKNNHMASLRRKREEQRFHLQKQIRENEAVRQKQKDDLKQESEDIRIAIQQHIYCESAKREKRRQEALEEQRIREQQVKLRKQIKEEAILKEKEEAKQYKNYMKSENKKLKQAKLDRRQHLRQQSILLAADNLQKEKARQQEKEAQVVRDRVFTNSHFEEQRDRQQTARRAKVLSVENRIQQNISRLLKESNILSFNHLAALDDEKAARQRTVINNLEEAKQEEKVRAASAARISTKIALEDQIEEKKTQIHNERLNKLSLLAEEKESFAAFSNIEAHKRRQHVERQLRRKQFLDHQMQLRCSHELLPLTTSITKPR